MDTGEYSVESASDAGSLMKEMEALYGGSVETEIYNNETDVETEAPMDEAVSGSDSLLEELEELFSGSAESVDTKSETSEQAPVEQDTSSLSALDELKAFLGDTAQAEAEDIETSSVSVLEDSFVSRRSILDELQNLLQSCLEELKADTKSTIRDTSVYTDVEYPSRDDLQSLLETTLDQLALFSDGSPTTTYTDSVSVLDEFKNFMHETGASGTDEISDSLFTDDSFDEPDENETDEYTVSSITESLEVKDKDADSILDELNLLLSDSASETFDTPLESDDSTSVLSDESTELDDPELDELAAYMAELSGRSDIENKTSAEEIDTDLPDRDLADTESASALSTLEELETMLNEIGVSNNTETSDSIKENEDDYSYANETGQSFADNKQEKVEDKSAMYQVSAVEAVADKTETARTTENTSVEDVNLLDEQDSNNRVPVVGLLLTAALAVGLYTFWGLLDSGYGVDNRSATARIQERQKSSVGYEKSKVSEWSEQSAAQDSAAKMQESEYGLEEKYLHGSVVEEYSGADVTVETGTAYEYEPLEEVETNSYEPISSYEPTGSYEDEPLIIETAEPGIDIKAAQVAHIDDDQAIIEGLPEETVSLEINNLLQENKENIEQLQRRMAEAESSIAKLQEEKTGKPDGIIEPVQPVLSEQIEEPVQADKAGFTEQAGLAAPPVHMVSEPVQPALPEPLEKPELRVKPELPVKQAIIEQPEQAMPVIRAQGKGGNLWSVQLSSYYGKPPPASELKYLEKAGISYEIKKAVVNEKVWYRVIVDEFSEYDKAKQFSDDIIKNVIRKKVIKKNVIRKDLWINKSQ